MQQITVGLNTILEVLKANELLHVITKAIEVENTTVGEMPKTINVEIHKDYIATLGLKWTGNKGYGYYPCEVLKYNGYKIDKPYLILKPNGSTEWVDDKGYNPSPTESNIEVPPIQEA